MTDILPARTNPHRSGDNQTLGRPVKVLHNRVQDRVRGDLELIGALAEFLESADPAFAQFSPVVVAEEFRAMMSDAVDLRRELANMSRFRANFADEVDIAIPQGFAEFSTARVLTMERMNGGTLDDAVSVTTSGWKVEDLAYRTNELFFEMLFRDGLFHADPHPGNFLLRPGVIVLLDFGDVGRLTSVRRRQLEDLVAAFSSRDLDELTDAFVELTSAPPETDLDRLRDDLDRLSDDFLRGGLSHIDMAGLVGAIGRVMQVNRLAMPSELSTVFRVLLLLQGLSSRIGAQVDLEELSKPYVRDVVRHRLDPQAALKRIAHQLRSWDRMASSLPRDLASVVKQAREGRLTIGFELRDPDNRVDHLVDGVVVGALVVASGELLSRGTRPLIGGISGLGLIAAAGALLTYRRMVGGRPGSTGMLTRAIRTLSSLRGKRPSADQ